MAKKESTLKNMVICLLTITVVASAALAGVYNMTKEPIAAAANQIDKNDFRRMRF